MAKLIETIVDRFDGGITNDPRDGAGNVARIVSNFDILSSPKRLTPYRDAESGDSSASTSHKQNFLVALRTGTTYSLYALGVVSGQAYAEILYKDLTTGAANDLDDATWASTANNASGAGATEFTLFVYYQKTGLIYGAHAGTHIWAYDPSGSAAFAGTHRAISYTDVAQGLVHSKDDILYIPYDNKIAKNDNGSWTDAALTLPTHFVITSISEYGNFLAIACAPKSGIGNSRVFLWDRDSSTATLSESIDWGVGSIRILEEIDGFLIGISQKGGTSSSGVGDPAGTISFRDRVIFRYLTGNRAEKLSEFLGGSNTTKVPLYKQKVDNRLYFQMILEFNGATRAGVWSYGRSSPTSPFVLIHERTTDNDTSIVTADSLTGFFVVGDYLFQSYQPNGGSFTLSKTNDSSSYTATAIYETKRFNTGDSSLKKDLNGITVMHEYLPTAGSVVVKYRKDEETSFTTILTNTTDNSISRSAVNIESSGAALPKDYKEIEFRIESTGGAEITGLSFKEEITEKRAYEAIK